jgi:SH3-like domain-containing protein
MSEPMRVPRAAALAIAAVAAFAAAGGAVPASATDVPAGSSRSGLPLPRFVSLKSDRVNLRKGPGTEYPTAWVYRRAGLPLEVVQEFEGWRQVRDAEGTTGWVLQSFLSGRRTALVLPWDVKADRSPPQVSLREDDSEGATPVAIVEAGVIASVVACNGRWCRVAIDRYRGWIEQGKLWGVYQGEVVR